MGKACRSLLAAALLFTGCARQNPQTAEAVCRDIEAELRHGNLSEAGRRTRLGVAQWKSRPESAAYNHFRLLEAEVLVATGKAHDAVDLLLKLKNPPTKFALRRALDLGYALLKLDRYAESAPYLEAVASTAERKGEGDLLLQSLLLEGQLYSQTGDPARARATWNAALHKAEQFHDDYHRAMVSNNMGLLLLKGSRYDQAIPYFEKARAVFEDENAPRYSSLASSNLAICYQELGDFDRALKMRMQVLATQERMGVSLNLANSYGEAGRLYDAEGDLPRSTRYYRQAFEMARKLDSRSSAALWALNLAGDYAQWKDWPNAQQFNRLAQRLNEDGAGDFGSYVTANAADIAVGQGRTEEAERGYRAVADAADAAPALRWRAHDELAKIYAGEHRPRDANLEFDTAVALISGTRAAIGHNDSRITFLSRPIRIYQDYVDALLDQREPAQAMLIADSSRAQVLLERVRAARPGESAVSARAITAAARTARSVLVAYWFSPRRTVAWVVTPEETHLVNLPETDARIRQLAVAYRSEIEQGIQDPLTNEASAGWKLADALIRPVQPWIPRGANVIVVPDGAIHDINLETLPVRGAPSHYWIDDAAVSVAPSLAALASNDKDASAATGAALLVGDPDPVSQYPKLSYAAREIESVEQRFAARPVTALRGPAATPAAYRKARPERFAYLHFAAHAEANAETPLDSAVILSPADNEYKLYARDIVNAEQPLRAVLVTVSACRSAGAKTYRGEGLIGFAWAFLRAGAHNVIAGLWDVDDRSTAQLMDRLYAGLAAGETPAVALRAAKLELVHSAGNYCKPYYWGPFQVYRRSAR